MTRDPRPGAALAALDRSGGDDSREDLRHHARRGRGAGGGARRLGPRLRLLAGEPARASSPVAPRRSSRALPAVRRLPVGVFVEPAGRRRSRRLPRACRLGRGAAARRRALEHVPSRCARRVIKAVAVGERRGCRGGREPRDAAGRRARPGAARRHGHGGRLGRGAPASRPRGALVLAGGLDAGERGRGGARPCGRSASTCRRAWRRRPGVKDPARMPALFEAFAPGGGANGDERDRVATAWPVFGRRDPDARGYFGAFGGTVRARDAGGADRGARERAYVEARDDPAFLAELAPAARALRRAADAALRGARLLSGDRRRAHLPEARGPRRTPARTRSTTRSARRCWRGGWASGASSPRPAPGSTAWRRPPPARCSGSTCDVYMGADDMARQALNVFRMRAARGAKSAGVDAGSRTLKDAINEAMRDWVANVARHVLPARLGARAASLPADGARVPVGDRPRGAAPDRSSRPAGCPTWWSPASAAAATRMGIFDAFVDDAGVRLIGVEAGGERHRRPGRTRRGSRVAARASCRARAPSCCRTRTGTSRRRTPCRRDSTTRPSAPSMPGCASRAAPSTGTATTTEALAAFETLARLEGILPALESAHAIAYRAAAGRVAPGRRGRPREPVRPRRQGRADRASRGGRGPGTARELVRIEERFAALRAAGRAGLVTYVTAGDPTCAIRRDPAGPRPRRRRRPRGRGAVLGSARRRAGHPARRERALAAGGSLRATLDLVAPRAARGLGADGAVHLRQPDRAMGLDAFAGARRQRGRGRRARARPAARGGGRVPRRARRRRPRHDLPASARRPATSASGGRRRSGAGSSTASRASA